MPPRPKDLLSLGIWRQPRTGCARATSEPFDLHRKQSLQTLRCLQRHVWGLLLNGFVLGPCIAVQVVIWVPTRVSTILETVI